MGLCIQRTGPNLSTVQVNESLLSDVETISGGVDGGEIDPPVRLLVGQLPALAAVGRAPFGVECAAEIWEVGEILEMRVCTGETVRPVRAREPRVRETCVPRDFMEDKDVAIRVVQVLGRGNILRCENTGV